MLVKTNSAGTLSSAFTVGKGGPTIRQGTTVPATGLGTDGDFYLRYGSTPGTYFRTAGVWRFITPEALPISGGEITGTLSHHGLIPTLGTEIDQIASWTIGITLTTAWQDTTITATNLATGTYLAQVSVNDQIYSGTMSWYSSTPTDATSDEITLHRAGRASDDAIYLRVNHSSVSSTYEQTLQISASVNSASQSSVVFRFRRMI